MYPQKRTSMIRERRASKRKGISLRIINQSQAGCVYFLLKIMGPNSSTGPKPQQDLNPHLKFFQNWMFQLENFQLEILQFEIFQLKIFQLEIF
jgi:hypothetical protein